MPPIQPDQAVFLLNVILGSLRMEHAITKRVIEAIPVDQSDYRPDPVSQSALQLAWHTVGTERVFLEAVVAGQFTLGPNPKPDSIKNSADLSAWYSEMFAEKTAPLESLTGEQLAKILDFGGMFQLPAVMYLNFALCHTIHHRGQLSTYLRPMGAKVPAMYGDSHDSRAAKA